MRISTQMATVQGVDMDANMLGALLKKITPTPTTPLESFLEKDSFQPHRLLPDILPILPVRLINRRGGCVTICGLVDEGTREYQQGFRYFSALNDFYREDGRVYENHESPDDLIALAAIRQESDFTQKDVDYKWVHPKHLTFKSFFLKLNTKSLPRQGKYYLNRMGFVIHLKEDDIHRLIDDEGAEYYRDGCVDQDHSSMFDLVYEIRSWDVFCKNNWAQEVLSLEERSVARPEMFNPLNDQKDHLMTELLKTLIKANEIAIQAGVEFGFHLTPVNKFFD